METKQITDKEEILKLFRDIIVNKVFFYLRLGIKEIYVKINRIKGDKIIINGENFFANSPQYVEFFFIYESSIYFGQLHIIDISPYREITAELPLIIFTRKERKYKRVDTKGKVYCVFNIITQPEEKKEEKAIPFVLRNLYNELQNEIPDVKKIFLQITNELKKISENSYIKFFKKDKDLSQKEKIIIQYKNTLFIANTNDARDYMLNTNPSLYITYNNILMEKAKSEGWSQDDLMKAVANLMSNDKKMNLISYIYSPIFLFGEVVGYIYSAISEKDRKEFSVKDVIFIKSLSDIASEALTKNKLFKVDNETENKITIENISQGGIMLSVKDPYLLKFLKEKTRLFLKIFIERKEVKAIGTIVRIEKFKDTMLIGIKFTEISPSDEKIIANFVESVVVIDLYP